MTLLSARNVLLDSKGSISLLSFIKLPLCGELFVFNILQRHSITTAIAVSVLQAAVSSRVCDVISLTLVYNNTRI
jgi:hypothetical protein